MNLQEGQYGQNAFYAGSNTYSGGQNPNHQKKILAPTANSPLFALWVSIVASLGMLIITFWLSQDTISFTSVLTPLIYACAFYLLLQKGARPKIIGGVCTLLAIIPAKLLIIKYFPRDFYNKELLNGPYLYKSFNSIFRDFCSILAYPLNSFIYGAIIACATLAAGVWLRHWVKGWVKYLALVLGMAGIIILYTIIFMFVNYSNLEGVSLPSILVNIFVFVSAALVAKILCELKSQKINMSVPARVWCFIVLILTVVSLTVLVTFDISLISIYGIINAVIAALCMMALCAGYRAGYPLMLICVIISMASAVASVAFSGEWQVTLTTSIISLVALINPLITWALIYEAWDESPSPAKAKY